MTLAVFDPTARAVADLNAMALDMHARQAESSAIMLALWRQARLHRQRGAELPDNVALTVVRELPNMADYDPWEDYRERWAGKGEPADGIRPVSPEEGQRAWEAYLVRLQCYTLTAWLLANADSTAANSLVRAGQVYLPEFVHGVVAEIVRGVVTEELPAAMQALRRMA